MDQIGLQILSGNIRWARISRKGKSLAFETGDSFVKPLYNCPVITGIPPEEVLFREIELPSPNKRTFLKLLPFQIEEKLPYDPEEAVIGTEVTFSRKSKQGRGAIFSVRSAALQRHTEELTKFDIPATEISSAPAALVRFARLFFPETERIYLLHKEGSTESILYIERGKLRFCHTKTVSLPEKGNEIERISAFLQKKMPDQPFSLVITGKEGAFDPSLRLLPGYTPVPSLANLSGEIASAYAVPIGLAAEGDPKEKKSPGFARGPFETPFMKARKKKTALTFLLACFLFASVIPASGFLYVQTKKAYLLHRTVALFPSSSPSKGSLEEWESLLDTPKETGRKEKKRYSVSLPLPDVSEVLTLLSTRVPFPSDTDIVSFRYELLEYPTSSSPGKPYSAKVTLGIESEDRSYEKIFSGIGQIDKKRGITKEQNGRLTLLSFFLQPYVGGSP